MHALMISDYAHVSKFTFNNVFNEVSYNTSRNTGVLRRETIRAVEKNLVTIDYISTLLFRVLAGGATAPTKHRGSKNKQQAFHRVNCPTNFPNRYTLSCGPGLASG